jgi:hypothetical protein
MGDFSKWLLHEDQKELFDYLFAIVLNIIFLAITALLLWPLGRTMMAFRLAKGYWSFWAILIIAVSLLAVDLYSHSDVYVITGLVVSSFLQAGWSAFAVTVVQNSVAGAPVWVMIVMNATGGLSTYIACVIVGAFFTGTLYRFVSLAIGIVSFIVFSVWPTGGDAIYGWFFDLF